MNLEELMVGAFKYASTTALAKAIEQENAAELAFSKDPSNPTLSNKRILASNKRRAAEQVLNAISDL